VRWVCADRRSSFANPIQCRHRLIQQLELRRGCRCVRDDVQGIKRMLGARSSSQASATVASTRTATSDKMDDCSGLNPERKIRNIRNAVPGEIIDWCIIDAMRQIVMILDADDLTSRALQLSTSLRPMRRTRPFCWSSARTASGASILGRSVRSPVEASPRLRRCARRRPRCRHQIWRATSTTDS
jgi:hypothetical protein